MILLNQNLNDRPLIIAELGNNHEGNFNLACDLVKSAADSGAHVVKFQVFKTENFVSKFVGQERIERLKKFELPYSKFEKLKTLCDKLKVGFLATPLDLESAKFLGSIQKTFKIASSDNNYWRLIDAILEEKNQLIISTGLKSKNETIQLHDKLKAKQALDRVVLMHCISAYPASPADLNLKFISWMCENMECPIGYSDHSDGIEASKIALCLGARVIEKHFTLDKNYSAFRDHALSADPEELKSLTEFANVVDSYLGVKDRALTATEIKDKQSLRRGLYAAHRIEKDETIQIEDVIEMRPMAQMNVGDEWKILGKTTPKTIKKGDAF